jgi:hypothetical protein
MPIIDPSMSAEQMGHFFDAILMLGFAGGMAGGFAVFLLLWLLDKLCDAILRSEDKRIRIIKARANARALNAWNQSVKGD